MSDDRDKFIEFVTIMANTRGSLVADGDLIDVTGQARDIGFSCSYCITKAAWEAFVWWTDADTERTGIKQHLGDRLVDVLVMSRLAHERAPNEPRVPFTLYVVPNFGWRPRAEPVQLCLVRELGDRGEPVLTLTLSDED
jgi:hypothetical protein